MKIFNTVISILVFPLKLHYFASTANSASDVKPESANEKRRYVMASGFRQYIAEYTVANFWRHPIRRRIIFLSALELRNRSALAVNCFTISNGKNSNENQSLIRFSCDEKNVKTYPTVVLEFDATADRQTVNYYSTIHALELIYFNYDEKAVSFRFFKLSTIALKKSRQRFDFNTSVYTLLFFYVYNAQNDVTTSNLKKTWSTGRMTS